MHIKLAKEIKYVLKTFKDNNYEAYIVGGFVRDSLMHKKSYDIDITCNASSEETIKIFNNYLLNKKYLKYGSTKFKINEYHFEITRYRIEKDYKNHRYPETIEHTDDINEDLVRRDFTINALCCNEDKFIDNYNGVKDLKNKVIKTIGDPLIRFEEDALRILRCLRFASKLNFQIDEKVKEAIFKKYHLLKEINYDVLKRELDGILKGINYLNILKEYEKIFKEIFILKELKINNFNNDLSFEMKEALFFYYSKYQNNNLYLINRDNEFKDKRELKYYLVNNDLNKTYDLLSFRNDVLKDNKNEISLLKDIIKNKECYNLKTLKVKYQDLKAYNIENKDISKYLNDLLYAQINDKCKNDKKSLLRYLATIKEKK